MTPVISIIMPCFNAARHLHTSIGSVRAQTFTGWELIIIDDGSTDETPKLLTGAAAGDSRIQVTRQANRGVSAARNVGIHAARGEFIAFLDADDTWAPRFLNTLLAALRSHAECVLAYCGWQNLGLRGPRGQPFIPPNYENAEKRDKLFAGCRWPIHAALTRRSAIIEVGGFDADLKNAEDYALWLELAGTRPIVLVPEVLAFYHFHDGPQASGNRASGALHHLAAQKKYLQRHPEHAAAMGRAHVRKLLYGGMMRSGFDCYWRRDLAAARTIFRRVMRAGYGSRRAWLYMLPSLLPLRLHAGLITLKSFLRERPSPETHEN